MTDASPPTAITVAPSRSFHVVVWLGFPLAGALAGWLLALGLDTIVNLSWAPFQGPLRLVDDITGSWTLPVLLGLGVVIGLALALAAYGEVATVTVEPGAITITRGDAVQRVARGDAATVFAEGAHLVVQDMSGRRRALAPIGDLPIDRLRGALTSHGYTWTEADPFEEAFSRWVENAPALPVGADAILAARQRALDKGHDQDAEDFRLELDKVGIVVRDDGKRQFWRPVR